MLGLCFSLSTLPRRRRRVQRQTSTPATCSTKQYTVCSKMQREPFSQYCYVNLIDLPYEPGGGCCSPPDSGKAIIFQAKAKFFGQKPVAINERKNFLRKKQNSFRLARQSAQNPGFLLISTGWGESGKVILQVSIAVFWVLSKNFSGKNGSAPFKKLAHMPMIRPPEQFLRGAVICNKTPTH